MGREEWKHYIRLGITAFCVIAAGIIFYFILFHVDLLKRGWCGMEKILRPLIYGGVLAYLFRPAANFLEWVCLYLLKKGRVTITAKKKKCLRLICVLLNLCLVLLLTYGLLAMLIPQLLTSIQSLVKDFPAYFENIRVWSSRFLKNNPEMEASVNLFLDQYSDKMYQWLSGDFMPGLDEILRELSVGIIGIMAFFKNLILGTIISIYILYSRESLAANAKKALYACVEISQASQIIKNVQYIDRMFSGYLAGMLLDSVNIGIMCYIGTNLLNMPYALLVSAVVAVTNMIPFFGPYLGGIPSTILIFLVNPWQALYFVLFLFALQQIDGNFIAPKILGETTGLTGFMVVVAIILGGGFFGITGMVLGVPVCAVLCTIIKNHVEGRLAEKSLPIQQKFYMDMDHIDTRTHKTVPREGREIEPKEVFRYHKSL